MNGRSAMTRAKGTKAKGGKLQVDSGGRSVPGFLGQDGAPGNWEARTGYTSENKIGPSDKSRKISLPNKNA